VSDAREAAGPLLKMVPAGFASGAEKLMEEKQ
jgi:hypothetical protein